LTDNGHGSAFSFIEVLTIDARVFVASVDTDLRFAEAANRLDLTGN
jgi:gas vesicle structural protein